MPQIANQDYNAIRPVVGTSIETDAAALACIVGNIERGTVFDVILAGSIFSNDDFPNSFCRVTELSVFYNDDGSFYYADLIFLRNDDKFQRRGLVVNYSKKAYEAFADIQRQSGENSFGISTGENDELVEVNTGNPISVNGKYVILQIDGNDIVVSWSYGDTIPEGVTNYSITEEEMNAFIGIGM